MSKKDNKELKVVNVRLIDAPSLYSDEVLSSPEAVANLIAKEFKTYDREVCAVINLNVKLKPININICSVGTLDRSIVNPREVFKSSILSNACAFMLVHNHPSGDISPSREDKVLTKGLIECGDLLNIKMIDHLIIGSGSGDIYSFKEHGLFEALSSNTYFDFMDEINNVMKITKTMEVEKMSKKNEKENAKVKGSTKKVKENLKEKESKKEQTKENKKDITKEKVNAKEKEKETLEKEIQSLQEQIEDRQLDLYYADSFEQSGQIREDIQMMEAKLSSLEERLKKTVEKASEKENKNIKEKVYLNVHNDFAKIGLESRAGNGQTFNAVTLPRGSIINGKDMGGGKIYPLDMYIYQNKFNKNLTTVQFKEGQEVQVNFKNGEHIKVKAEDLCKGVTEANKEYLSKNKDIEKSIKKEKDNEMEI